MELISPNEKEVEKYLERWEALENYVAQESSLRKLFTITYPNNTEMDEVLIKVCSLNDFYSTNIYSPFSVAKNIIKLNIDLRLKLNDVLLVNDIAKVNVNGKREFNFYSFATKYCSHHKPEEFPIFDSYVERLLMLLKKQDGFYDFRKSDLKEYKKYKEILIKFRTYYKLDKFNLKEIDKYLWQLGKNVFPRKEYQKQYNGNDSHILLSQD